jgi:hypothetical protein
MKGGVNDWMIEGFFSSSHKLSSINFLLFKEGTSTPIEESLALPGNGVGVGRLLVLKKPCFFKICTLLFLISFFLLFLIY